jgi:hypothetical protein
MTNKQKELIDKVSKVLDKAIGEAIAGATMTMMMANVVDDSFDDESADYFRDSILKVLNDYVKITKEAL